MPTIKVWILGANHPNADKSISWEDSFPNFTEPDILIINLTTLDEETLKRINKEKLEQASSFIMDKFLNNGKIIFITTPNFDITNDRYMYSNYALSPIRPHTKIVPQGTRMLYNEDYDFSKYIESVQSFDFYFERFDSERINHYFYERHQTVRALPIENQEVKDNGGHFLGCSFSLFHIDQQKSEYRENSGEVIFLPPPTGTIEEALSILLYRYGKNSAEAEIPPDWISKIKLPIVSKKLEEIEKLKIQDNSLQEQIHKLENEKQLILNYRKLIYSKSTELENIVFEAFKILGFDEIRRIREEDREDWIFEFKHEKQFKYGIIEVKGADTRTKQQHIVQTSKWVDERFDLDKKISKGIFIPNQFRLKEYPKSKKEREKFEPNELEYAQMKNICIIPSFVLFESIKDALENKNKSRKEIEKIIAGNSGIITKF